jgi:HPt (histidine-containing phosphotransfer) domain-containing protein
MDSSINPKTVPSGCKLIDVTVIFDIYNEDGEDIIRYALGIYRTEATKYFHQLCTAVANKQTAASDSIFHSLKTMSSMVGARLIATLCAELELLPFETKEFIKKFEELQQLWPSLITEVEHYLGD